MAIIESCCCECFSVRAGSCCVAFYTSIYFTITLLTAILTLVVPDSVTGQLSPSQLPPDESLQQLHYSTTASQVLSGLLIPLTVLSVAGVVSSVLLVIGLAKDRRCLLLPLIFTLSGTAVLDLIVLLTRVILDVTTHGQFHLESIFLCVIDTIIQGVNLLCVVCVVSQYQKYSERSGDIPQAQLSMTQAKLTEPTSQPGVSAAAGSDGRADRQPASVGAS